MLAHHLRGYGIDPAGNETWIAFDWITLIGGDIFETMGVALGYTDTDYFWTGSKKVLG